MFPKQPRRRSFAILFLAATTLLAFRPAATGQLPDVLTTSNELAERLEQYAQASPTLTLESIGQSVQGKPLLAVRVTPAARMAIRWRVLMIGSQHGNEHAGKEAILQLLGDLHRNKLQLPPGVELLAVPMINPDANDLDQRRNANDFDLNRDHLILSQPETRALHQLVQRTKPHVIVDAHEFTRDSPSYTDQGFGEWPLIMMDTANAPLLPDHTEALGLEWIKARDDALNSKGFNYQRYTIGGPPPDAELRHSTLDPDDARNGLSFYGGLGFIIESGVKRSNPNPQADLHKRTTAYRLLLDAFLTDRNLQAKTAHALQNPQRQQPPQTIPTNALWVQGPPQPDPSPFGFNPNRSDQQNTDLGYPVIDLATGQTKRYPALNAANTIAIKQRVATPAAYAVLPEHADQHAQLLDRHAVPYQRLTSAQTIHAQTAQLDRIEEQFDEIYQRYGGRQIVSVQPPVATELPAGSLLIDLQALAQDDPFAARRAIKALEPQQLYGLYQWPQWKATVANDGTLPILRVMPD